MNTTAPKPLTRKERKDMQVLVRFTAVYCKVHHRSERQGVEVGSNSDAPLVAGRHQVCSDCRDFLAYAIERRRRCPLEPKPACKHCEVHCYRKDYRERVRTIMRFSGRYLLLRGRVDLLWHYFF